MIFLLIVRDFFEFWLFLSINFLIPILCLKSQQLEICDSFLICYVKNFHFHVFFKDFLLLFIIVMSSIIPFGAMMWNFQVLFLMLIAIKQFLLFIAQFSLILHVYFQFIYSNLNENLIILSFPGFHFQVFSIVFHFQLIIFRHLLFMN